MDAGILIPNTYKFDLLLNYNNPVQPSKRVPVVMKVRPVNISPVVATAMPDQPLEAGGPTVRLNLSDYFSDANGDALTYKILDNTATCAETQIIENILTITPLQIGTARFTIKASDPEEATVSTTLNVVVKQLNKRPLVVTTFNNMVLRLNSEDQVLNLAANFSDPDNDALKYGVLSTQPGVIQLDLSGSVLKIRPLRIGETEVKTWAEDPAGAKAETTFTLKVILITGTEKQLPHAFTSYPNPFKEKVLVSYTLDRNGFVTLSVFDVTGVVQQTLVSEYQAAGLNEFEWDGQSLPSGVYFYRLTLEGKPLGVTKAIKN
jgi:hypothetical protein